MDGIERIERALRTAVEAGLSAALGEATSSRCPGRLAQAMRYAVFPGGARIRPRLCLAVACACGDDDAKASDAAATAIELLHCASLVHDDLPCFDDAAVRRGKPSLHRAFDERIAILTGDALIVLAFQALGRGLAGSPYRLPTLLGIIAQAAGTPQGAVAGQAWECEPRVGLGEYHRAKTGALFAASTLAGAVAAGADPSPWRELGEFLGDAYQVADDLQDAVADPARLGKPTGRDATLGRPSAVSELGIEGSVARLHYLVAKAMASIPPCRGAVELRELLSAEAQQFLPRELRRAA